MDDVDDAARARWTEDEYRFAPYQYVMKNLAYHRRRREWTPAPTESREKLMGFRAGHTEAAALRRGLKLTDRKATHLRDSLVGNAVHTPTVAVLLAPCLVRWGILDQLPQADCLEEMEPKRHLDAKASGELRLARMYAAYQTHRGNEIRLENGPCRTATKPTWQAVRASQWTWRPVVSCQWQIEGESMPALETRAVILALKWRARSVERLSHKFLHLVDSQSALGCSSRHRSSMDSLNYLVERGCAIQLAGRLEPVFAFVRTHLNPADRPSRTQIPLRRAAASSSQAPQAQKRQHLEITCQIEQCQRPSSWQCVACLRWICRHHTMSVRRGRSRCFGCGPVSVLSHDPATPPQLPAADGRQPEGGSN